MLLFLCGWLACLALVFLMARRAPIIDDVVEDDASGRDCAIKPTECRPPVLS